jgi:hypothetical protein
LKLLLWKLSVNRGTRHCVYTYFCKLVTLRIVQWISAILRRFITKPVFREISIVSQKNFFHFELNWGCVFLQVRLQFRAAAIWGCEVARVRIFVTKIPAKLGCGKFDWVLCKSCLCETRIFAQDCFLLYSDFFSIVPNKILSEKKNSQCQ